MVRRKEAAEDQACATEPALDAASLPDATALAGPATSGGAVPGDLAFNTIGSARYLRASLALFLAGFATFSLLYCPQPLLPTLARAFGVDAASSSLAISLGTGCLAISIIVAATVSDRRGRKSVMIASMVAASVLNAAAAVTPGWIPLLMLRALEGIALGGVPAVAMTYLAEETDPRGLGLAMGIYVGATAVGGMSGRVISGMVAEAYSWRVALAAIGGVGLASALGFALLLPASRHFRARRIDLGSQFGAFRRALSDPRLVLAYAFAFTAMGGFVAIYNYAGFRLEAPPYSLDQAQEGLIFTLYLLGSASSAAAGTLADRFGRPLLMAIAIGVAVVGVAVTAFVPLAAVVLGIALVTVGFFAAHGVASGTIGALAGAEKAQAASLYLLSYYAGSSVLGTVGGLFWTLGRWPAVAGFVAVLFCVAAMLAGGIAVLAGARPAATRPQ